MSHEFKIGGPLDPFPIRERRAQALTSHVMHAIDRYICDHHRDENAHRAVSDILMTLFMADGAEIVTDEDRRLIGLPRRGRSGWTAEELYALEAKRLAAMLEPMPPFILKDLKGDKP